MGSVAHDKDLCIGWGSNFKNGTTDTWFVNPNCSLGSKNTQLIIETIGPATIPVLNPTD
jgi:hypothetical protein